METKSLFRIRKKYTYYNIIITSLGCLPHRQAGGSSIPVFLIFYNLNCHRIILASQLELAKSSQSQHQSTWLTRLTGLPAYPVHMYCIIINLNFESLKLQGQKRYLHARASSYYIQEEKQQLQKKNHDNNYICNSSQLQYQVIRYIIIKAK